jgi:hypothetical protein
MPCSIFCWLLNLSDAAGRECFAITPYTQTFAALLYVKKGTCFCRLMLDAKANIKSMHKMLFAASIWHYYSASTRREIARRKIAMHYGFLMRLNFHTRSQHYMKNRTMRYNLRCFVVTCEGE